MPNKAFEWGRRLKAVEREYVIVCLATDRLHQHTVDNPETLKGDLRLRDIGMVVANLEGTYLLRLFAEFEIALRHYLRAFKVRVPPNAESLINKVRDRAHIANEDALKAHAVRVFRNTLIHDDEQPAPAVSMRDGARGLGDFLGWLQRYW